MKLLVKTFYRGEKYTLSKLYIDGVKMCDIIEDKVRALPATCPNTPKGLDCKCKEKVYGETAIPAGTYKCEFTMSSRFKRKLLAILNVPHFIGIRMHRGNTEIDSHGCTIVGENKVIGKVINSTYWEEKLNNIFEKASNNGEEIEITIER